MELDQQRNDCVLSKEAQLLLEQYKKIKLQRQQILLHSDSQDNEFLPQEQKIESPQKKVQQESVSITPPSQQKKLKDNQENSKKNTAYYEQIYDNMNQDKQFLIKQNYDKQAQEIIKNIDFQQEKVNTDRKNIIDNLKQKQDNLQNFFKSEQNFIEKQNNMLNQKDQDFQQDINQQDNSIKEINLLEISINGVVSQNDNQKQSIQDQTIQKDEIIVQKQDQQMQFIQQYIDQQIKIATQKIQLELQQQNLIPQQQSALIIQNEQESKIENLKKSSLVSPEKRKISQFKNSSQKNLLNHEVHHQQKYSIKSNTQHNVPQNLKSIEKFSDNFDKDVQMDDSSIFKKNSISTVYKKNSYYDLIIKKEKILKTLENLNDEIQSLQAEFEQTENKKKVSQDQQKKRLNLNTERVNQQKVQVTYLPFEERQSQWLKGKQQRLQKTDEILKEREIQICSFNPKINAQSSQKKNSQIQKTNHLLYSIQKQSTTQKDLTLNLKKNNKTEISQKKIKNGQKQDASNQNELVSMLQNLTKVLNNESNYSPKYTNEDQDFSKTIQSKKDLQYSYKANKDISNLKKSGKNQNVSIKQINQRSIDQFKKFK